MHNSRLFAGIAFLLLIISSCTFVQERYPKLPPGPYRAILKLENTFVTPNPKGKPLPEKVNLQFDEVTDGELPFTMEVEYINDEDFEITIFNGEEAIKVPTKNISYGRDASQGRDTLRIEFPVYDSYISAYHEENVIEGVWVVNYRSKYRIPFIAKFGENHRFTQLRKTPVTDMTGNWEVTFGLTPEDSYKALGEFQQEGNKLTGTFRTETGDFRYLDGTVQADKFYLSVFDGSHAFLFEGKLSEDGQELAGSFRSGRHYITKFTGKRNADFILADPDTLTHIREDIPMAFSFPDTEGNMFNFPDEAYDGKVKLVSIMGSWCPNCRDETEYLKKYLADHPEQDIQLISLAFERYGAEDERSMAAAKRFKENMEINWPVLLAGSSNKKDAAKALPMLNHVLSYPTLLFIDKQNKVRKVHTGFNGPATSAFGAFDKHFKETMEELLAE